MFLESDRRYGAILGNSLFPISLLSEAAILAACCSLKLYIKESSDVCSKTMFQQEALDGHNQVRLEGIPVLNFQLTL